MRKLAPVLVLSSLWLAAPAFADDTHDDTAEHGDGAADHGDAAHGEEINWFYGFFSESDDPAAEEDLITRRKGRPVPFLAYVINAALLFGGIGYATRRSIKEGLVARRAGILKGIDEASKMKQEAAQQLAMYTEKLRSIDAEVERVRKEMAEAAAAERTRIVAEAKARRERMEREARELVKQELEAMREELMQETARGAVRAAEDLLQRSLNDADHARLTDEYLASLHGTLEARGRT